MRVKVVWAATLLVSMAIALVLLKNRPFSHESQVSSQPVVEAQGVSDSTQLRSKASAPAPEPAAEGATTHQKQQAYVEQRVLQLQELSRNDDRDSLEGILAELTNRDPEIRHAAIDATVQFGSRDAIPALEDAALQTDDPREKVAIADAIEFLRLPSVTQFIQQTPLGNAGAGSVPTQRHE